MTHVLLTALVPIFSVMALGYLAGWIRDIDNHHVGELNALVMDFALPASLFVATASTSWATLMAHWPLLVVFIVSMLVLYSVSFWMQRHLFGLGSSEASVQALTIAMPSYAAAGLPLIAAMYGPSDSDRCRLGDRRGSIVMSPLTLAVLETKLTRRRRAVRDTSRRDPAGRRPLVVQADRARPGHRHGVFACSEFALSDVCRPFISVDRPGGGRRRAFPDRSHPLGAADRTGTPMCRAGRS